MLKTKVKQNIIKKAGRHEKDTGSNEVQTAMLNSQIELLSRHLKKHRKDESSRRGLLKLVARRRNLQKQIVNVSAKQVRATKQTSKKIKTK